MEETEKKAKFMTEISSYLIGRNETLYFITITDDERTLEMLGNLLNELGIEKWFVTEEYTSYTGLHYHMVINKEIDWKKLKGKNNVDIKKIKSEKSGRYDYETYMINIIFVIEYMIKEIEYWGREKRFMLKMKDKTKKISDMLNDYKKSIGYYEFLEYGLKDEYVSGIIFIKALKKYFNKIKLTDINKIYEKEKIVRKLILEIKWYIRKYLNNKISESIEERLKKQILLELYNVEFLNYHSFYLTEKKIKKLVEKIKKKNKINEELIEMMLKKILTDINKVKRGEIIKESYKTIINKVRNRLKYIVEIKDVTDIEIVGLFKVTCEILEKQFKVRQIYEYEKTNEEKMISTYLVLKKRIMKEIFEFDNDTKLEEELKIRNGIFYVKPKDWMNYTDKVNYSGGYIFNEVFEIRELISKRINNFSEVTLTEDFIIETINLQQRQEYQVDPVIRLLLEKQSDDKWEVLLKKHFEKISLTFMEFGLNMSFWTESDKCLKDKIVSKLIKKSNADLNTKYQKFMWLTLMKKFLKICKEEYFYYCNYIDYRGRIYYSGWFNVQSSKFLRNFLILKNSVSIFNTEKTYMQLISHVNKDCIILYDKESYISSNVDSWEEYINNFVNLDKILEYYLREEWDLLKMNCIFIRTHYRFIKKKRMFIYHICFMWM